MADRIIEPIDGVFEDVVNMHIGSKIMKTWSKPNSSSPKVISLFNHKGGVSKTTTTFNLGWMLANKGLKVLIVDTDPQCNLTGLTLGINDYDDLFAFYDSRKSNNVYNSLAGHFGFDDNKSDLSRGVEPSATKNENLKLLAGHISFSKFDLQLATALTSSQTIPLLKPLIGSVNQLIRNTAESGNFDFVLIDMSPSVSAMNMCVFMASDYFILPTSPDFYCYQAIDSLSEVLPEWAEKMTPFKDGIALPRVNPKMLGVISQNYRVYSKGDDDEMTNEFRKWADKIKEITNDKLVPALKSKDMVIGKDQFSKFVMYDTPYNIANIQNFNSLVPVAQSLSKPFFELKEEDANWSGGVWSRNQNGKEVGAKVNIQKSHKVYSDLSDAICGIVGFS